jgi:hypothetical protein
MVTVLRKQAPAKLNEANETPFEKEFQRLSFTSFTVLQTVALAFIPLGQGWKRKDRKPDDCIFFIKECARLRTWSE